MHSVVRYYSGPGAVELFGLLEANKDEVRDLIRGAKGFVAYTLVRTESGGVSVTVCEDKVGTDQSSAIAREWIENKAPNIGLSAPGMDEGDIILQIS